MTTLPSPPVSGKTCPDLTRSEEHEVRNHPTCAGCGRPKDPGCLVCWPCFKYREVDCFKYWASDTPLAGNVRAWLEAIGRPSLEEQGILQVEGGAT